jgi:hypothetical protein
MRFAGIRRRCRPRRALVRDADTPESLAARAADLYATGPGVATLADAGGENVKGLLERVAQTPGAGRTIVVPALTERQQGQMGRIVGDLGELTGTQSHGNAGRRADDGAIAPLRQSRSMTRR